MTLFRKDLLKLQGAKLVVYGDLMVDEYWRGSVTRVSPEGAFPVFNRSGSPEYWLGGAGSALHRARMLGVNAQFVGVAGAGPMSDMAVGLMRQIGADVEHIIRYPLASVSVKTRLLDPNGHQCLTRLDNDYHAKLDGTALDLVTSALKTARESAEWILVSDYGKGMVTPDRWSTLLRQGWKIVVDGKMAIDDYHGADVVQMNRETFRLHCGGNLHSAIAQMQAAEVSHLVVTRGKDGLRLIHEDGLQYDYRAPARDEPPLSITGAGDQAAASLACALAAGMDVERACQFAQLSASLAVRMGGIPSLANVARRLPVGQMPDYSGWNIYDSGPPAWGHIGQEIKLSGQKLVFCNGIFDLFHQSHADFLRRVRDQAPDPFVVVGVNSDASAKQIKRKPIIEQYARASIVSAHRAVNGVILFDDPIPTGLITALRPDVYVSSADHGANSVTAKLVRRLSGDVVVLPRGEGSTSFIITKISSRNSYRIKKGRKR